MKKKKKQKLATVPVQQDEKINCVYDVGDDDEEEDDDDDNDNDT